MQGIDSTISRLGGHCVVGHVSGVVNVSMTVYDDAQMASTYIMPLGQVLQLIVKIMDNVTDVSPHLLC
jgi:riboflavin synthase alpha subunit